LLANNIDQLWKLNLFYDGLNNTFVAEFTKMFVSIMQDQIEQRPLLNHLSAGNSRYHARFSYSCDFVNLLGHAVACDDCYLHMRQATASNVSFLLRECDLCTSCLHNMEEHPLLRSMVPKDHPIDAPYQEGKDGERLLVPFQLSYDCLSADILMAHQKIVEDSWSPNEAKCFLSVICMDTKTNTKIVRLAKNCQSLREVQSCVGELSATSQRVLGHYQQNPEEFHPLIPISW
jgi:hypothetical protein